MKRSLLFEINTTYTAELTLIDSSGFQITKSASIPTDKSPLRSSRPHNLAGWLLNSFETSESDIPLVLAAVHISGNPICIFEETLIYLFLFYNIFFSHALYSLISKYQIVMKRFHPKRSENFRKFSILARRESDPKQSCLMFRF